MQYVVSTIWKHPADMDQARMREVQAQWRDNENLVNIYWIESCFRGQSRHAAGTSQGIDRRKPDHHDARGAG